MLSPCGYRAGNSASAASRVSVRQGLASEGEPVIVAGIRGLPQPRRVESHPDIVRRGALATDFAGIYGPARLDQHDRALAGRDRLVLDAARHDVHLAGLQVDLAVAELEAHLT